MNLINYYYYFTKALSEKVCDDIINLGTNRKKEIARTRKFTDSEKLNKEQKKDLFQIRNSNVAFLNDKWIYRHITPYINEANKQAGWNFDINWSETCQFTKYGKNQFYDWHCDSDRVPYGQNHPNKNLRGKIRKLSVTVSLTDPSKYKGGNLEFVFPDSPNNKKKIIKCKEALPKGSIIVFPSFVYHRVTPVTKGTRHSLVIWTCGNPFK